MKKYKKNILKISLIGLATFSVINIFSVKAESIEKIGAIRGREADVVKVEKDIISKSKITKKVLLNNNFISMKLDREIITDSKTSYVYVDEANNEYLFQNEMLTGFIKDVDLSKKSLELSKEHFSMKTKSTKDKSTYYQDLADKTAESMLPVGYNLNDYTLRKVDFVESYNEFVYNYVKEVGPYKTNDSITISITLDGKVTSALILDTGKYDDIVVSDINEYEMERFVEDNMARLHGDIEYTIEDKTISEFNSKKVINIYVSYWDNGSGTEQFSYYI